MIRRTNRNDWLQEWTDKDHLLLLQGWARDGATDIEIATKMGISEASFYKWLKQEDAKAIKKALKKGKEVVDYAVENSLLKEALNGNVTAQIFWLKNRRPEKWREKRDVVVDSDFKNIDDVLIRIKETAENEKARTDEETS